MNSRMYAATEASSRTSTKRLGLADYDMWNAKQENRPATEVTRRESRVKRRSAVRLQGSGVTQAVDLSVRGRVALLDAAVVPLAQNLLASR
jgi:hypothetical protein